MARIKRIATELQVKDKLLDYSGDAGTSGQLLSSTGTGTNWITFSGVTASSGANTRVAFFTGSNTIEGATGLYWNNSDNRLGIGTSSPNEQLHISATAADIRLQSTGTNQASRYILQTDDQEWRIGTHGSRGDNLWIYDGTSGNYRLDITPAGNVGIGTMSPSQKLDVAGTARMDNAIVEGTLYAGDTVTHWGDGDTKLQFGTNDIKLIAGGATHFHAASNQKTIIYSGNSTAVTFNTSQNATFSGSITSGSITSTGTVKGQRLQAEGSAFPQQFIIDTTSGGGNSRTMQVGMSGNSLYFKKSDDTGSVIFRNSNNTNLMTIGLTDNGQVTVLNELEAGSLDINGNADISGNLTISGTVDGRDVAADGTKLDTIATNADVTPSWVPSSNPNYLTSSSTQSKYLRSDEADTAAGKITFSQNAATIALAGTNHTYAEFYKTGTGNARSAYLGFGSGSSNHFSITNEISGGKVVIDTNGGLVEITDNTTISGNLTVTGDFTITGDLNTMNVTDLDVVDKTITIGKGQTEASSGGSGIIVDGSSASILWDETNNTWDFNKSLDVVGNIHASGNVGIGTSLPAHKLDINGGAIFLDSDWPLYLGSTNAFIEGNSSGTIVRINASDGFKVTDGGNTRLLIDTDGKVGIGTTSPGVIFDIVGSGEEWIRIVGGASNVSGIRLGTSSGSRQNALYRNRSNNLLTLRAGVDDSDIQIIAGGSANEIMRFDGTNSRVGIRTTSPSRTLHIGGPGGSSGGIMISPTSGDAEIQFQDSGTTNAYITLDDGTQDLNFRDDSATVMTIDFGSERVGVGTTSPDSKLHVGPSALLSGYTTTATALAVSDVTNGAELILRGLSPRIFFDSTSGGHAEMYLDGYQFDILSGRPDAPGSSRFYIKADGKVGIGTTSPGSKLHVDGTATFTGNTGVTGTGNLTIRNTSSTGSGIIFMDTAWQAGIEHDAGKIHFRTGGQNDRMTITSGGNVGIGTSSPQGILNIFKNSSTAYDDTSDPGQASSGSSLTIQNGNTTVNSFSQVNMQVSSDSNRAVGRVVTIAKGGASSDMAFVTENAGVRGEKMRILANGNLGIGTTSPNALLDVDGGKIRISSSGTRQLEMGTDATISFGNDDNIQVRKTGSDLQFKTGGSERMRIDSSGNVGIGTTSPSQKLSLPDNAKIGLGNSADLQIYHTGTGSVIQNATGNLTIQEDQNDGDIIFRCDDGSGGTTEYFRIDGGIAENTFYRTTKVVDNYYIGAGNSTDLYLTHDGTNSSIINNTGNLTIQNNTNDGDIIFRCDDGSGGTTEYLRLDGSNPTVVFSKSSIHTDNIGAYFGTGLDLKIYHDSSNSYIQAEGTGDLVIEQKTDDKDILFKSDDGSGGVTSYFELDGSAVVTKFRKHLYLLDNVALKIGNSYDLDIKHDGTDSYISNATGNLYITNSADDKDITFRCDDGSGGTAEYFSLDGSIVRVKFSKNLHILDNVKAEFGGNNDLQIYHDGSNSYIQDASGTGDIRIASNIVHLNNAASTEVMLKAIENGAVELYHNNSKKFETKSTGVNF